MRRAAALMQTKPTRAKPMEDWASSPPSGACPRCSGKAGHEAPHGARSGSDSRSAIRDLRASVTGSTTSSDFEDLKPMRQVPTSDLASRLGHDLARVRIERESRPGFGLVRRSAAGIAPGLVPASVHAAVAATGRPLPQPLRSQAEAHFATGLGHVRLHDDATAAKAAAHSLAHGLTVGPHILLSRPIGHSPDAKARHTLAHEIAHTMQPQTDATSTRFGADDSEAEHDARHAADSFVHGSRPYAGAIARHARSGVARERDPRLDALVQVVAALPRVLSDEGVAQALERAAPGLDLDDLDNAEPLRLLLDEAWMPHSGEAIIEAWRALRSGATPLSTSAVPASFPATSRAATRVPPTTVSGPAPAAAERTSSRSMSGTELRAEIDSLRSELGMPALLEDAPSSETFEPHDADDRRRLGRLEALEAEYFRRRGLMEASRELTTGIASQQRSGIDPTTAAGLATTAVTNPSMLAVEGVSALLGHPIEDFTTGFLPGFLGGAVLELPADAFERLDAETREHPILFNAGVIAGVPLGAGQGLWDMLVGLAELLGLALELSPTSLASRGLREVYRMATSPEGYQREQAQRWQQARAVGEAIVTLVGNLLADPAFMISHGQELGEIAGRAAANWFNTDFMRRSTFDKGLLVGRVEGRIVFEIVALLVGPEEWIARGASAAGELARISAPLRRAIVEAIEHVPALERLLQALRGAAPAAREAVDAERVLSEGGEVLSGTGRAGDTVTELGRGNAATGRSAPTGAAVTRDEASAAANAGDAAHAEPTNPAELRALDAADLERVGEVNPETTRFFAEHPDRLHAWAENAEATRVCKLCRSPCFPENVTPRQAERLERLIERARARGVTIEDHALHDPLMAMEEHQIDDFIAHMEGSGPSSLIEDVTGVTAGPGSSSSVEALSEPASPFLAAEESEVSRALRLDPMAAHPASAELAREIGLPAELTDSGHVYSRADFPDLLPDRAPTTGRVAPERLDPVTEFGAGGWAEEMRPVSRSDIQNTELLADYDMIIRAGADPASVRVNQMQIIEDMRVGTNRPDLYFELNGRRILIEYDRAPGTRSIDHAQRILANDPDAIVILKILDFD